MIYQKNHKHFKKPKSLAETICDVIVALIIIPFKKTKQNKLVFLDKSELVAKWQKIEELVKLCGESRFKQAVIEADKLLDLSLKSQGILGETMGERLKNARDRFDRETYQDLWRAHKVRNDIVHARDRELLATEAENTIKRFKKGLEELGLM